MPAGRRFPAEQTFSDGDPDFLGSAGAKSGAEDKIVRRLPQIARAAFGEDDLADRIVAHVLFFGNGKIEALGLSRRQGFA
jgi:hypothetical protein